MSLNFSRDVLVTVVLTILHSNPVDPELPQNSQWYQYDGVPPHYTRQVGNFLNQTFMDHWVGGVVGPLESPARSPDLRRYNFFISIPKKSRKNMITSMNYR